MTEMRWNPNVELQERLLASALAMPNGCLEWTGYRIPTGYGKISYAGKSAQNVHRLSFLAFKGPIEGLDVCHRCDNPPCFNPFHLFVGTAKDNALDMMRKRRHPFALAKEKTHCKRGHEFAGHNLIVHKTGRRQCRQCLNYVRRIKPVTEAMRQSQRERTARYRARAHK